MNKPQKSYSSKKPEDTRVKVKPQKKTVGITLPPYLIENARKHKLNISKTTEQALLSIIDYMETQNSQRSSNFLDKPSFPKEGFVVPRAGLELATTRSSASPPTMPVVESGALPI